MLAGATRFPLSWPTGWPRTPIGLRRRASFRREKTETKLTPDNRTYIARSSQALTVADAMKRLTAELDRLGAANELLSTNVETRLDGLPRSGQAEPKDPGAACYFTLKKAPRVLACDRWDRVADNIAAIAQHIDALRRIDRYGVGTLEQAFRGYAALQSSAEEWWTVLGVQRDARWDDIEEAYRKKLRDAHPDVGGTHEAMARLNLARDAARQERGAA